jgi:hypothetical protein
MLCMLIGEPSLQISVAFIFDQSTMTLLRFTSRLTRNTSCVSQICSGENDVEKSGKLTGLVRARRVML